MDEVVKFRLPVPRLRRKLTTIIYLLYYKIGKKLACFGHNLVKNVPIGLIFGQEVHFNGNFQWRLNFSKWPVDARVTRELHTFFFQNTHFFCAKVNFLRKQLIRLSSNFDTTFLDKC